MALFSVSFVLGHQPNADILQNIGRIICSFLGPAPSRPLHEACAFRSLKLLDWIWSTSSERSFGWSLTNFLRSDPFYYNWEFVEAMKLAAARGDLKVLEWLMTHFAGCQVGNEVVDLAAGNGHLRVLQYLLDHSRDRVGESGHVVQWGGQSAQEAVRSGHYRVVQWLYEHELHTPDDEEVAKAVCTALRTGGEELASFLVPTVNQSYSAVSSPLSSQMAEWVLACSHELSCAVRAFEALPRAGGLDLMQSIVLAHSPFPEDQTVWLHSWDEALIRACRCGDVAILRWLLVEHPIGSVILHAEENATPFGLMCVAAKRGWVEIMELLTDCGVGSPHYSQFIMMLLAVGNGQLDAFKWMLEHGWYASGARAYLLVNKAAEKGHVEILQFLQTLESLNVLYPAQNGSRLASISMQVLWGKRMVVNIAAIHGQLAVIQWLHANRPEAWSTNVMNVAAKYGHLDLVQWLHINRHEGCTTEAMDGAAANDHLDVLQWLHANRSESCSTGAMDEAAANGHLQVVQWLHGNLSVGCTTDAMDLAAANGHLNVVRWLHENRSEGCTVEAITGALTNGHVRVADWLRSRVGQLKPTQLSLSLNWATCFEALLFLHVHHADLLTPEFIRTAMHHLLSLVAAQPNCRQIIDWIQENYIHDPSVKLINYM